MKARAQNTNKNAFQCAPYMLGTSCSGCRFVDAEAPCPVENSTQEQRKARIKAKRKEGRAYVGAHPAAVHVLQHATSGDNHPELRTQSPIACPNGAATPLDERRWLVRSSRLHLRLRSADACMTR